MAENRYKQVKKVFSISLGGTARSSPTTSHRGVAQLVARMLWEHDVGCSSHLTPTNFIRKTA